MCCGWSAARDPAAVWGQGGPVAVEKVKITKQTHFENAIIA
jgi:hypothetical protein